MEIVNQIRVYWPGGKHHKICAPMFTNVFYKPESVPVFIKLDYIEECLLIC